MSDFKINKSFEGDPCELTCISGKCLIDKRYELTTEIFKNFIQQMGLIQRIETARTIVLKPNFAGGSLVSQKSHAITDPKLIWNVIKGIRSINDIALIYIAESDSAGKVFAFLKFENLALDEWRLNNVKLLDLSRDRLRKIVLPEAKYFRSDIEPLWLSEKLLDADMFISLANLKTHAVTKYTGACKNLFGLLPNENKYIYHPYINEVIYDLTRYVKPCLSIIDGFRAMEENGPITGRAIDLGLRIYSSDAVMADAIACKLVGIDYHKVKHLHLLAKGIQMPEIKNTTIFHIKQRSRFLSFSNFLGFLIQRIAYGVFMFGHRIHCAESIVMFMMMAVRPILLILFDIETLRRWKRSFFNER